MECLDELAPFLADYKIGIVDIFDEIHYKNEKNMDVRVYECIECADLPNIGKPLCFFEAGILMGIFKEFTKQDVVVEEVRCWTNGYSFCQFDVKIRDLEYIKKITLKSWRVFHSLVRLVIPFQII